MNDDLALLREYADHGSQKAFAALVARHVDLVHSAALRQTRNRALADDVTQGVFVLLAHKAASLQRETYLSAWLLASARYLALDTLRREARRQAHERKAAQMKREMDDSAAAWPDIADLLDWAMSRLTPAEREAIVLRYFRGQSTPQIATALGASPDAAKQRVHRALERLRGLFARRGLAVAPPVLIRALGRNAIEPAPAPVAAGAGGAASSAAVAGSGKAALLLATLVQGKLVGAGIAGVLLAAAGTGLLLRQPATSHTSIPPAQPVIFAAADAAPNDDPNAWRKAFDAAYGLEPGEAAKLVSPPFIPERQAFWDSQSRTGKGWTIRKEEHFLIKWDRNTPRWQTVSVGPENLSFFLSAGVGLRPYEFHDWKEADKLELQGDWVIAGKATEEAKLAVAESVVLQKLGKKVHFELRKVKQDVYVATGQFELIPLDPAKPDRLVFYADPRPQGPMVTQPADLRFALDRIEDRLRMQIVDETTGRGRNRLVFEDDYPPDAHLTEALDKVTQQTGVKFTKEQREMEVWFMTEAP